MIFAGFLLAATIASDVIVGSASNFDELTLGDLPAFVEFYAPWCGHCQALEPVWEELATKLKGKANVIKVDATIEEKLANKFEIESYPTIKFFKPQSPRAFDYEGYNELPKFLKYFERAIAPSYQTIKSVDEIDDILKTEKIVIAAFYPEDSCKDFKKLASAYSDLYKFVIISDQEEAKTAGVSYPGISIYRSFDEKVTIDPTFSVKNILGHVERLGVPLFGEISHLNYNQYESLRLPIGFAFLSSQAADQDQEEIKATFTKVAKLYRQKLLLGWVYGDELPDFTEEISGTNELPSFGIDKPDSAYRMGTYKDEASLLDWLERWSAGDLVAHPKTEETDEDDEHHDSGDDEEEGTPEDEDEENHEENENEDENNLNPEEGTPEEGEEIDDEEAL